MIVDSIKNMRNHESANIDKEKYKDYADFFNVIEKLCDEIYDKNPRPKYYCARINDTNNIVVHESRGLHPNETFNIICTNSVSFTGTIGARKVEKNGGIQQHLDYLQLFMDYQGLPLLKSKLNFVDGVNFSDEKQVLGMYMQFYSILKEYFETYPMAMYDLMTGIKQAYSLPSIGIVLTPENYDFINFDNFKSVDLINNAHKFSYDLSENVPSLKISYEGTKLMHLRTKTDYRSRSFRLKFMMETAKNFFKIFNQFSGDIKNGF